MLSGPDDIIHLAERSNLIRCIEEGYTITEAFSDECRRQRESIENGSTRVDDMLSTDVLEAIEARDAVDPADVLAVRSLTTDVNEEEAFRLAMTLGRFEDHSQSVDIPTDFTPLREDEIDRFLSVNDVSVLLFWKEGSEACSLLKDDFEVLSDSGVLDDIALGSIYTPDCSEMIRETYQIGIVPTTLFCIGDRIDARLIGVNSTDILKKEITTVRDRAQRFTSH